MGLQMVLNEEGVLCWTDLGYTTGKRDVPDPRHGKPVNEEETKEKEEEKDES